MRDEDDELWTTTTVTVGWQPTTLTFLILAIIVGIVLGSLVFPR